VNSLPWKIKTSNETVYPIIERYIFFQKKIKIENQSYQFNDLRPENIKNADFYYTILPYQPNEILNATTPNLKPFLSKNVLGTDRLGVDFLSMMIYGTQKSFIIVALSLFTALVISLLLVFLSLQSTWFGDSINFLGRILQLIGLLLSFFYAFVVFNYKSNFLGAIILFLFINFLFYLISFAFFRNKKPKKTNIGDALVVRILEITDSLPKILILLFLSITFSNNNIWVLSIIIALSSFTYLTRYLRNQLAILKNSEFILSASTLGIGNTRLIIFHVLPHLSPIIYTIGVFLVSEIILLEAGLSIIGLGLKNEITLGYLIKNSRFNLNTWWLFVFPILHLLFISLSIRNITQNRRLLN
jgi:ABC-type dipeptide/oligopeptide/nickel transport system permease subunit